MHIYVGDLTFSDVQILMKTFSLFLLLVFTQKPEKYFSLLICTTQTYLYLTKVLCCTFIGYIVCFLMLF